jgi:uracil-DNA glycosylase
VYQLLRLIFGLGLGADHAGEFLDINGERAHIFECFALVNFLLCSAVRTGGKPTGRLAGKPGRSTKTMRANCSSHFRAALDILEPTLVVAQGYGVREWIATAYGLPAQRPQDGVEQVQIGATMATLVSFSHPSAHAPLNWGLNERMPYLLDTVAPTIAQLVNSAA